MARKMFTEEKLVAMGGLAHSGVLPKIIVHDGGEEGATITVGDFKIELHHDATWEISKESEET